MVWKRASKCLGCMLGIVLAGCGSSTSSESIHIGAIYSLSGDQSTLDRSSLRGAQLAVDHINESGGVNGTPIALVVRDGKTSSSAVASEADDLYRSKGLSIVIGLSDTDLALPVATTSEAVQGLFVTSGATGPPLVVAAPRSTFLACFSDDEQARAAADYCRDHLQLRAVSLIYDETSEYAHTLSRSFKTRFANTGGRITSEITYEGSALDLGSIVAKLKAESPRGIFLAGQPQEVASLISAIRAAGVSVPIIGGDSFDSNLIADLSPAVKSNVFYSTHVLLSGEQSSSQIVEFIKRYTATYGEAPTTAFTALGYDTVNLVARAIEVAGSTEPLAVRMALEAISKYPGVTGTISYGVGRHIPAKDVTIATFVGDTPVRAAVMRP